MADASDLNHFNDSVPSPTFDQPPTRPCLGPHFAAAAEAHLHWKMPARRILTAREPQKKVQEKLKYI